MTELEKIEHELNSLRQQVTAITAKMQEIMDEMRGDISNERWTQLSDQRYELRQQKRKVQTDMMKLVQLKRTMAL